MRRRPWLPTLSRHLLRAFLGTFALTMAAFLAIYVLADFFDRIDVFLKHDAPLGAILRSFIFKLPSVVTQVTPMAVLAATLIGLGLLARNNEFIALRACGVSMLQVLTPLLLAALLIAVATFVWNETVVPASARRWHEVDNFEIRKRGAAATLFTGRDVWYHGKAGFYNIDRVALGRETLYGLLIYEVDSSFRVSRLIDIAEATWTGTGWHLEGTRVRAFTPEGLRERPGAEADFTLPENLADFRVAYVEPEEFSFGMLRRQITQLRRKGIDTSESWVDLHLKLALPAGSLVMMLLAVPLAVRGSRGSSLAAGISLGFAIGFAYFFVLGFARALGQTSTLPPAIAAWAANAIFALVASYYVLGSS